MRTFVLAVEFPNWLQKFGAQKCASDFLVQSYKEDIFPELVPKFGDKNYPGYYPVQPFSEDICPQPQIGTKFLVQKLHR